VVVEDRELDRREVKALAGLTNKDADVEVPLREVRRG